MFGRLLNPLKNNSFFLFGARGTGKTRLIKHLFADLDVLYIDLLDSEEEFRFSRQPGLLKQRLAEYKTAPDWVVIDAAEVLFSGFRGTYVY